MSKQGAFESGVLLYWMATKRDALPDYPAAFGTPGSIFYDVNKVDWSVFPSVYPLQLQVVVRSLLECDPLRRALVGEAIEALQSITKAQFPSSSTVLSVRFRQRSNALGFLRCMFVLLPVTPIEL